MTDSPTPELRALAARLFAAGRAERPDLPLSRRLALLAPQPPLQSMPSNDAGEVLLPERRQPRSSRLALWLAAAGVFAGVMGGWVWFDGSRGSVMLSPDPVTVRPKPPESLRLEHSASSTTFGVLGKTEAQQREPLERSVAAKTSAARTDSARSRRSVARAPSATLDVPAPSAASQTPPPIAAPSTAKALTALEELELLKRARAALRSGQGGQALDLLDRHARERAGDGLAAEAALLRMEALSALGRSEEASALASRFVRENPNSALSDRAKSFVRPSGPPK